jgi:hypothetical protein
MPVAERSKAAVEQPQSKRALRERVRSERELRDQLVQYAGRWVAVIDYTVVRSAATWDQLLERLNKREREGARVFRVPEHPEAIHLY